MLDQNTDRMWYVIGAVIVGAALIFILNGTMPELFASVGTVFQDKTNETTTLIKNGGDNLILDSNTNLLLNKSDYNGQNGRVDNQNLTTIQQDENGEMYFSAISNGDGANVFSGHIIETTEPRIAGDEYTVSFDIKTDQMDVWAYYFYTNEGQDLKEYYLPSTNGEWMRYSHTFIQKQTKQEPILFGFGQMKKGKEFGWRKLKLEKGNTATPWRPALADYAS